ncbi:quinone-dependent dihydroorotate dehydrogenase [Sphingomonas flavescens]|uniref:quinone-dependent dihydroorotate dehydrogenase n=1 Tax=Sphingomonas flavescens TaxID=3132797 RepID=UPI0028040696|nr:quinone-dependent dihydroorotate dehydrogenase [Sphingomonas limnosediminicola]
MALYPLLSPLIFRLDAERAHRATISLLKRRGGKGEPPATPELETSVSGLTFSNPVGLAAGFDKDAEVFGPMLGLGFGSVEVGTLTPRPQPGNPKPRLFRLVEDQAVINRMGFNSGGQDAALALLRKRYRTRGIVGVNVGANKDSADRIADYAQGVRAMSPVADYLTVNISSPNTPGLRQLQDEGALRELLAAVREGRQPGGPPLFLKVAPDLEEGDPIRIVRAALDHGVDALIVANTTVSRPKSLRSRFAAESGGLSGAPLAALAHRQLEAFYSVAGKELPLISAGGISDANDVWWRIRSGASLVQLYSAMVYRGPGIARRITKDLQRILASSPFANIAEAVGTG